MAGFPLRSMLLSTLVGGIVAFLWTTISWNVLDWHYAALSTFDNDNEVVAVIRHNAPGDGIYVLPSGDEKSEGAAAVKALQAGPLVFASVRLGGFGSFSDAMAIQVGVALLTALLISWLSLQMRPSGIGRRVVVATVVGIAGGLIGEVHYCNWWGFPASYTGMMVLDAGITWALAGLAMTVAVRPWFRRTEPRSSAVI